ncbi:TMEM143 family protein [Paraglaciecola aquimarina]|uniref:TMEM143 family protein n=1 Tax=Paraglaciecola aquimarina TaxID=1235557 RepID=A0ABU3SU70_9ALTE|nr:TMEM143 family protein [Paraglaciecola aquimarina]MDU0353563.1 TMEM143 family protein [Paraglaciecola aquimarina]
MQKNRFIPMRKTDLIQACIDENLMSEQQSHEFATFCQLLVSTLHFEYHQKLEVLKDSYAPFEPNSDTISIDTTTPQLLQQKQQQFSDTFIEVLNAANFEKVTDTDLQEALNEESLFKVRLAVEFNDFAEVVFYRRGEQERTEVIRKYWGLKKQRIKFTNYEKVAVYIKFKDAEYFKQQEKHVVNFEPGSTVIKLFQNIPKADLEMLFPNSEVRMRPIDKVIIGGSAVVGGAIVLVTKLGASLVLLAALISYWLGLSHKEVTIGSQQLVALGAGFGVLGGFIFKEWSKFKNRKLSFMKALTDNLYFKNLDNNSGVFHHLIDSAEEEECKESILAYYFLLANQTPMSRDELDNSIEVWFNDKFDVQLDFEIEDALAKLVRFGLVTENEQNYTAVSVKQGLNILDENWDQLFKFN